MSKHDNTNRGALWARADGLKATGDRTPPVLSGVLDVDGVPHNVSLWFFEPEDDNETTVALRKAIIALTKEAGGKLKLNEKTGGRPVAKLTIQPRESGAKPKSRKSSLDDLSSQF